MADRAFNHEGFKASDLRFFETLAANAGVALRSSELLERLRKEVAVRQHQAYHDTLTGLPNRAMFTERLAETLAVGPPGRVATMFIDLDGFKEVNDTLGHVTGDAILREVAHRLTPFSRGNDLVARLGGDEFALLVAGAEDELDVEAAADQVLSTVTRPLAVEGLLLDVRASIGVAIAPERRPSSRCQQPHAPCRCRHVPGQSVGRGRALLRPRGRPLDLASPDPGHRAAAGHRERGARRLVPAGDQAGHAEKSSAARRCCAGAMTSSGR